MKNEALVKLVFGIRGCGKSVKVRRLIQAVRRLLIVDTKRDYTEGVIFDSLADLKVFWRKVYKADFRLIYRPPRGDDDAFVAAVDELCTLCEACENMTLVVEELNILFDDRQPPKSFNDLVFGGRHPGIELIGVAQRPFGFGRDISSQAKEFYVFYTREPDDVTFFRRALGSDAAEAIRTLEQFHYLRWVYADGVQNWEVCKDELL